ncbi:cyclic nucleotide-binding domain-containing protein [Encephalitozoon hellem ATCC 50504]|uniref:cGMP-dependent protein kinase n=1 Tax=Encephalitozoon hellem TaxID=27973 RepID=A0A9Q9CBB5_ENCHE|nr:cyclic nucleotide-binding domain-containing protein [Encephalitozoon hellem ATCC 50504]AFM98791.1 cyclic nucleotide-binding domain-containing protein [Encephalitozoon hellem ATCC 50504]UTX43768.1 cGMP-dependent protein kinase [Encephalitozoon hellem]WEL39246.1 cGMP-dependent protein kinase [Encephalitozoon hellem]|eukprot:XP_003887772.1 cyclic nucleotide-binding domain-containing protein [Encephalitozoon hellem ATCC 50504]
MSEGSEAFRKIEEKLRELKFSVNSDVVQSIYEMAVKEDCEAEDPSKLIEKLVEDGTLMRLQLNSKEGDKKGLNEEWRASRRSGVYSERVTPETFQLKYYPKDEKTMRFLSDILVGDIPFGFMNPEQKIRLIESMELIEIKCGTFVMHEEDVGSQMYIVDSGEFEVTRGGSLLRRLSRGSLFGEIALLHNIPRTATVKAVTDGKVWVAEQTSFSGIRMMDRILNKRIVLEGLKEHKVFPSFREEDYEGILSSLSFVYYKKGSKVEVKDSEFLMSLFEGEIDDGKTRRIKAKEIISKGFTAVSAIQGAHISRESQRYGVHVNGGRRRDL